MILNRSRRRGDKIKKQAMMLSSLSPDEERIFNQFPVNAISQNSLMKLSDPGFDSPGLTSQDEKGNIAIYVRDKFPYSPKLTYENYKKLPPFITEKDVISHEMGHARDFRTEGLTSEPSAIDFEHSIVNRGLAGTTPRRMTLGDALLEFFNRRADGEANVIFPKKRGRYLYEQ